MKPVIEKRNLRHWRLLNDLTQEQLAKSTGLSVKTISLYEQDNHNFQKASYENVKKIADTLNIGVDNFKFF